MAKPIKVIIDKKARKQRAKNKNRNNNKTSTQEISRLGSALRALGHLGGAGLGSMIGYGDVGGQMGTSLGAAISKWLGSGDYTVSQNTLVSQAASGSIPMMHRENQTVVIRHKEYLGEIRGKQTFTVVQQYAINPGLRATFPWLSGIANSFQEYRIRGMVYHYVPTSGNAVSSTNAALGTVMIQTSYRSNDDVPTSKVELLNEYWSSEGAPSEAFCHPVECNPKENPFNVQYVRTGGIPDNDSILLYDLGKTNVAVSGQQADDKALGDLWITYEIELKKPIINSNVTSQTDGFNLVVADVAGSITGSTLLNGAQSLEGNIAATFSGNTITLPTGLVGYYLLLINVEATTTFSAVNMGLNPTLSNCLLSFLYPGTQIARNILGGTSPTLNRAFYAAVIQVVEPSLVPTITLPSATLTGAALKSNVWFIRVE
nr:MAG: hypothetical protein 2 [Tombusviridae sp.]